VRAFAPDAAFNQSQNSRCEFEMKKGALGRGAVMERMSFHHA
jgi:hypothetical protein